MWRRVVQAGRWTHIDTLSQLQRADLATVRTLPSLVRSCERARPSTSRPHTTTPAETAGGSSEHAYAHDSKSTTQEPEGGQGWAAVKGATVDRKETDKFSAAAELWWNTERGPFAPLHSMNPARCRFIRDALCAQYERDPLAPQPLEGLSLVDVGCGGGLLAEPLARMGASVLGIDAAPENIRIATLHSKLDPVVAERVQYRAVSAEELVREGHVFDAVTSLEVIEHVADVELFATSLAALTRPGGALVMSTLNRNVKSYVLGIAVAEHLLGWVPPGTHEWTKFVTPEELTMLLGNAGLEVHMVAGMGYNPLSNRWALDNDISMNYIMCARKPAVGTMVV